MKTVIVFDTEDKDGMRSTLQIINYLSEKYLHTSSQYVSEAKFSKVKLVKMLKDFAKWNAEQSLSDGAYEPTSLYAAKKYADKIFLEHKGDFSEKY